MMKVLITPAKGVLLCATLMAASGAGFAAAGPASTPLTRQQATAFRDSLKTTMDPVPPESAACGSDQEKAVSSAIAANLIEAVNSDGAGSASELSSMVIQMADDHGYGSCVTGHALAAAALALASANPGAAKQIATPVANQGSRALSDSFRSALSDGGAPSYLAAVASESPSATQDSAPATGAAPAPVAPAPCPNPSCT